MADKPRTLMYRSPFHNNELEELRMYAGRDRWGKRNIEIAIVAREDPRGRTGWYCSGLEFSEMSEGKHIGECMELSETWAQMLMDDLWNAGMRPTEGSGSAGSLAATQQHLADMKKIAFDLLEAQNG